MSSYDFLQHGRQLVESGQYQEAVKVCRLGLLAHPTALPGRLLLGNALIALRRYDEVLAEMRVALEIDGTNAQALALRGEAMLRKGDAAQAVQVLNQAHAYAPADKHIANLCRQAEDMVASGAYDFGPGPENDSMTKHYPVQLDPDEDEDATTEHTDDAYTRPEAGRQPVAASIQGFSDDRTSTIELDPSLEGYELIDDEGPARLDASDSAEMTRTLDRGTPDQAGEPATGHYRKLPPGRQAPLGFEDDSDDLSDQETNALGLPRAAPAPVDDLGPVAPPPVPGGPARGADTAAQRRTMLHEIQRPVSGQPPPARAPYGAPDSGPAMDELFPEDETGISRLAAMPDVPAGPPGQVRAAPNQPTMAVPPAPAQPAPPAGPLQGAGGPSPRQSADMRVIRAGLGLDPEGKSELGPPKSIVELKQPGVAPPAPPPSPGPAPPPRSAPGQSAPGPDKSEAKKKRGKGKQRKKTQAAAWPEMRTEAVAKKRSPLVYMIYALVASIVVAGGVYAGFEIREIRLGREIDATRKDAMAYAQNDTYDGYLRARAAYAGIVSVRSTVRTRAALARTQAAIAAEFGDGLAEARELVESLGSSGSQDAMVARAYLAVAEGDPDIARLRASDLEKSYPDEPMGPYLSGRAALLDNKPDAALAALERALKKQPRPLIHVAMGRAHLAKGALAKAGAALERALEAVPGHPEALIARAQLVVASGGGPQGSRPPDSELQAIIDDIGKQGIEGVSKRQRARAALTLASLELLRGDYKGADKALTKARDLMPEDSRSFSTDYIRVLLSAGDTGAAKDEADRAAEKWPDAMGVQVARAEVALVRDQPGEVLAILEGDVSSNAQALAVRGRAYLALDNPDKAAEELDAALALSPALPEAIVARADVDLYTGDARAALTRLEPIYAEDAPPEVGVVYAAALRDLDKRQQARTILERLVSLPHARRAYLELARLERAEGNFEQARQAYDKAILQAPKSVDARLEAALLWLDTGAIGKAQGALAELAEEHPSRARVLVEAARVFTMTGGYKRAEALLHDADKLDTAPKWKIARERGRLALRRGQRSSALSELGTARSLHGDDAETRLLLLYTQLKEDDPDDLDAARKTVEEMLKHFPRGMPQRDMVRARFDLAEDRIDDALKAYRQARETLTAKRATPRRIAEVEFWIGRAHFLADRLREARASFAAAIKRDPGHADARFFLGLTQMYLRSSRDAERAFAASVEIDPAGNPEAWFYLGELRFKRGRRHRGAAREAFKTYLELRPDGYLAVDARDYLKRL